MIKTFKRLNFDVKVILLGVLLTSISTFMLSPFLTLYMNSKGFSAAEIGIVLTSNLIFQQGLTFFGGLLGDKYGYRTILIIGLIIRIAGYIAFIFSNSFILLLMAGAMTSIGGALITPSTKASIAISDENRAQSFALRNVAVNTGAAIGPMIGSLLYNASFYIIFLAAAFLHLMLLVLVLLYIKNFKTVKNNIYKSFKYIIHDFNIIYLTAAISLFWILYSQLSLSIPLYLKDHLNKEILTGTIFTLNGLIVIIFQVYLLNLFEKKFSHIKTIYIGMIFLAVSFATLYILPNLIGVYIFIVIFTVGEILIGPSIDNLASSMAPNPSSIGGYIGFASLGWALGGSLGNLFGGYIYSAMDTNKSTLIWPIYMFIAILGALLFRVFKLKEKKDVN